MESLISALRAQMPNETDGATASAIASFNAKEKETLAALQQEIGAARRRRLMPSVIAYDEHDRIIPPLLVKPKGNTAAAATMPALARAARAVEAQLLLRCVAQWEQVCAPLWKALAGAANTEYQRNVETKSLHAAIPPEQKTISRDDEMLQLSYGGYKKICAEIDALRQEGLELLSPAARKQQIEYQKEQTQAAMDEYRHQLEMYRTASATAKNKNNSSSAAASPQPPNLDEITIVDPTFFDTAAAPADARCDEIEDRLLRFYAEFLPKVDASLFLSCPRHARTGTVDVRVLYEYLQIQIAVAKFAAEMLLFDDVGDRTVSEQQLEQYVTDTLEGVPGSAHIIRHGLVDAHKTVQVERFVWLLDSCVGETTENGSSSMKRRGVHRPIISSPRAAAAAGGGGVGGGSARLDLLQIMRTPDLRDMLLQPLKPEELSGHPSESVRWFTCANTTRMIDEFRRLDQRSKQRISLGDMRRYRKFLRDGGAQSPLRPDTSPISFSFTKRYFECTPTHSFEMDFRCFVRFVLTVELLPQRCPRPDLFFDCFDVDGSGVLTPTKMSKFMGETRAKLSQEFDSYGATAERQVDDLFHVIRTAVPYEITRREFIASVNAGLFCALTIDAQALMTYEQRDWTNPKIKQEELSARPFSGRR